MAERGGDRLGPAWLAAAAVAVGILGDLAVRAGLVGIATAALVLATAGLPLASGGRSTDARHARAGAHGMRVRGG